jgi:hypothetical protein
MPVDARMPPARAGQRSLSQAAGAVLMVRPSAFGWNPETAASNRFQQPGRADPGVSARRAVEEFDGLAATLRAAGVEVHALDEPVGSACPDAVFPNNWVSLHHDGTVVLYPMLAPSRRRERRMDLLFELEKRGGYAVSRLVDLTQHELSGRFLEGTGSVVFDHAERVAYACLSPRTDQAVLEELCDELGYEPVTFDAKGADGAPVYHTNVLLSIGRSSVILCAEAVVASQRESLLEQLRAPGRQVVAIDRAQMSAFAGNALELEGRAGNGVLVMSQQARRSLSAGVLEMLQGGVQQVVAAPVPTIERLGGGSVRCMLAEVFLPRRAPEVAMQPGV